MGLGMHLDDHSDEWIHVLQPEGLKVIIVGGGIGGLAAAIALRQQGHTVDIYESSGFSKEVGAALHTAPNANGILKRLGISCKDIGANVAEWMTEWTYSGTKVKKIDLVASTKSFEHKWRCAHRVRLHDALRKAATKETGFGRPANLHLSKAVQDIDASNAIVHFQDGTFAKADVVIGADGVHSIARSKLPGGNIQPFPSGQSAFRFLIPTQEILADPRTSKFVEDNGNLNGIFGPDRSVIMYPTSNNTVVNFVCIHPDTESVATEGWGSHTATSRLLEVYKDFDPDVVHLLSKADESSLKVWKLLDMAPLPLWCQDHLAVIGDAAHPFLPFLGQGAAIALEDAVAIGVVLEQGLSRDEVPERLRLYQQIRKERAELVQHYTRLSGRSRGEKVAFNVAQYQGYCFGYNEVDNSTQKLREWKWAKLARSSYPMSSIFGPVPSLQQLGQGQVTPTVDPTFTKATIRFSTSRTLLDGLLPPGNKSYRFKSPATIAQCTFQQTSFRGLPSLGGRGYKQLSLYIHDVQHEDAQGNVVSGAFVPIVFENMADTIVAGREERGMPKVWSTIDVERDRRSYHVRTGWEGLTWGNFYLGGLDLVKPKLTEDACNTQSDIPRSEEGTILHRYVPQLDIVSRTEGNQAERTIHIPGTTPCSTETEVPPETHSRSDLSPTRTWKAKSAHFQLNARDWDAFPTLHHIISRLQELPILNVIEAKVVEGSGIPD